MNIRKYINLGAGIIASLMLMASCVADSTDHDNYIPGGNLHPKTIKATVDELNDSILNARINKYNAYRADYKESTKPLESKGMNSANYYYNKIDGVHTNNNIYPIFARELKIEMPNEYSNYLYFYERDSIDARYIQLYYDSIVPKIKADSLKINAHLQKVN